MAKTDIAGLLRRARERLGGISIERMNGDNLAITLCSHFDDPDQKPDENGWTEAAEQGCDETLDAIHAHYAAALGPLLDEIEALREAVAEAVQVYENTLEDEDIDREHCAAVCDQPLCGAWPCHSNGCFVDKLRRARAAQEISRAD